MVKTKYLGRQEILEIDDTVYQDVDIPEWGGSVKVRSLTGAERDAYEMSVVRNINGKISLNTDNMRARLISLSCIDEEGKRLFTDRDVKRLGTKSGAALDRIYEVCQKISGLETSSVDEALQNFLTTPNGNSTSN